MSHLPDRLAGRPDQRAEIWEVASSLIAGIKMLRGSDPERDYNDKVAKVSLR